MTIRRHEDLEMMSRRRLSDSLEATRTMLRQAQSIAQKTQAALIGLATEFCGSEVQKRQETNEDLTLIPADEWAALLRQRFKSLTLLTSSAGVARLTEANLAIEKLREEVETQRKRADQSLERAAQLERQVQVLERSLENQRQAHRETRGQISPATPANSPAVEEIAAFQAWYSVWQQENRSFERDRDLILFIGRSGACISTEVEAIMAQEKGISSRTVRRALMECMQVGLLEEIPTASIEGRPPPCYTLTEKGVWLYHELTGYEPKSAEHLELLKAHKSERHLALILKTAEHFTRMGYAVDREPVRLELEAGRFYQPDLVVRKDDETFYLEVETGEKDKTSLSQKWENATAGGGKICVVADNMATLRRIQGSIAQWSVLEGRQVTLFITCLDVLKARQSGEQPWYAVKDYRID